MGGNGTLVGFHQSFADGQTQSESAKLAAAALFESIENVRQRFRIDAATGILHFSLKLTFAVVARSNAKLPSSWREFDGVLDQVPEDLFKPRRICSQKNCIRCKLGRKRKLLFLDLHLAGFDRVSKKGVSVYDFKTQFHFAFADPSKIEEIVNQPRF